MRSLTANYILKKENRIFFISLFCWCLLLGMIAILLSIPSDIDGIAGLQFRINEVERFMDMIQNDINPPCLQSVDHSYGLYFYAPYFGAVFKITDAGEVFLIFQLLAMLLCSIIFPFEIYGLFHNKKLCYVTPVCFHFFLGNILYGIKNDVYWSAAWSIVIGLPLLCLLYKCSSVRKEILITFFLGIVCSAGNILRNHNSIPCFVVFAVIMIAKCISKKRYIITRLILLVVFWILYNSVSSYIPLYIGTHYLGQDSETVLNVDGNFYHTVLGGLGYCENEYGLAYDDPVIAQAVNEYYSRQHSGETVQIYGNGYWEACKDYFFYIIKDDPVFVVKTVFLKFMQTLIMEMRYLFIPFKSQDAFQYFYASRYVFHCILFPCIICMVSCAAIAGKRKLKRKFRNSISSNKDFLVIICGGILLGTYQSVIAVPYVLYDLGSMACIALFCLVAVLGWLNELLRDDTAAAGLKNNIDNNGA